MPVIVTAIRDALHEAGASEETARAAAGALADFEARFTSTDRRIDGVVSRIDVLEVSLKAEISAFRSEFRADAKDSRTTFKADLASLRSELKAEIATVKSEAVLVRFLLGLITTLSIAVFLKLFLH